MFCSTRYPDAIALLTRLLQSTHTNSLLTSTQKVLNHTLPLGSYLLKPVQRILKYHLLLDVRASWLLSDSMRLFLLLLHSVDYQVGEEETLA